MIIKNTSGDVIFEGDNLRHAELRLADLCGIDLDHSNLCGANLQYADIRNTSLVHSNMRNVDLRYANLFGSNMRYADLCHANLVGANMRYADLRHSDMIGAKLRGANLNGADLRYATLPTTDAVIPTPWGWAHIQRRMIRIGCQYHPTDRWILFNDDEIDKMGVGALDWCKQWRGVVLAVAAACEEYK